MNNQTIITDDYILTPIGSNLVTDTTVDKRPVKTSRIIPVEVYEIKEGDKINYDVPDPYTPSYPQLHLISFMAAFITLTAFIGMTIDIVSPSQPYDNSTTIERPAKL